jgi:hypothetical protein
MKQELKQEFWTNEAGQRVPTKYLNKSDKLKERYAHMLARKAAALSKAIAEFKQLSDTCNDEVFQASMDDYKVKRDTKGNFGYGCFDGEVKVEVSVNERITFDDLAIAAAKQKLDEFLHKSIDAKVDFVRELVVDAFSTTRGKLDAKKVMSLTRYKDKVKDELFQESIALIEKAIRRPDSKRYTRFYTRQDDGSYKAIELNFSSI